MKVKTLLFVSCVGMLLTAAFVSAQAPAPVAAPAEETKAAARRPHGVVARGAVRHVHPLGRLRRARRHLERQADRRHRRVDHEPRQDPRRRVRRRSPSSSTRSSSTPTQWVQLAKDAGMKYIVITSKHHDGFAHVRLQGEPTGTSSTPRRSSATCSRSWPRPAGSTGIKLGFYYSQAQDWHHPGGAAVRRAAGTRPRRATWTSTSTNIAVPQVKEILTQLRPDRRALVGHADRT